MAQVYSRWHRFDGNGVKYIKRFDIQQTPQPLLEEGFTEWVRGTGPHSEEALENLRVAIQRACKGVPKSPVTKQKMREAKLGKPKSEQHKLNMKLSHQRRRENVKSENTSQRVGTERVKCT